MATAINTTHERTVRVTGKGDTKQKAFAQALSQIQKQVVENVDAVTLQITPRQVTPVSLQSETYRERFLLFFFPRTRTTYHATIDVLVTINAIDLTQVPFEEKAKNAAWKPVDVLKGGK